MNEILRDRFVAGLNNICIQHHLLTETTLTFTKAQEIAQAMELAERDVQSIQADSQMPVHKIATPPVANNDCSTQSLAQPPSGEQTSRQCYRCGGKHSANSCQKSTTCIGSSLTEFALCCPLEWQTLDMWPILPQLWHNVSWATCAAIP